MTSKTKKVGPFTISQVSGAFWHVYLNGVVLATGNLRKEAVFKAEGLLGVWKRKDLGEVNTFING